MDYKFYFEIFLLLLFTFFFIDAFMLARKVRGGKVLKHHHVKHLAYLITLMWFCDAVTSVTELYKMVTK